MTNIKTEKNILIRNNETRDFLADAFYPNTNEKLPLLLFAHGYKGYKDWGSWNLMAKKFAENGFFFVKFNFSHNGTTVAQPTDFADLDAFGHNNFSKEMSDYDAVFNHFYNHKLIDANRIAIMGHSRGGGISIIKAFEDQRVKALVTFAGVSDFKNRFPTKEHLEAWKRSGVIYAENSRTQQKMPHYFQFFEDFEKNQHRFSIQFAAQHLEKPFLILHGTNDETVTEKESFLLHEWCKTSELKILENANHTFGAKEPWTENHMAEDLEEATAIAIDFLKKHLQ